MGKLDDSKIQHILSTLESLQYGSVEIIVHNGEVMQVNATEKKRFSASKGSATSTANE